MKVNLKYEYIGLNELDALVDRATVDVVRRIATDAYLGEPVDGIAVYEHAVQMIKGALTLAIHIRELTEISSDVEVIRGRHEVGV